MFEEIISLGRVLSKINQQGNRVFRVTDDFKTATSRWNSLSYKIRTFIDFEEFHWTSIEKKFNRFVIRINFLKSYSLRRQSLRTLLENKHHEDSGILTFISFCPFSIDRQQCHQSVNNNLEIFYLQYIIYDKSFIPDRLNFIATPRYTYILLCCVLRLLSHWNKSSAAENCVYL